jgi:sugar O-acyltransferase (sialic acid O-acetyltransferase NeuD family)
MRLIIIGAGMFGREVLAWAQEAAKAGAPYTVKGFIDDNFEGLNGFDCGVAIIGSLQNYIPAETDVFVCAIGNPMVKRSVCGRICDKGGRFTNVIHPTAVIGPRVKLGVGVVIGPFSSLTTDVSIGNHVSIGVLTGVGHDVQIGQWCQVSGHCSINGCARLGDGVFMGAHSTVLPGVEIGEMSYIGAGSVVLKKVRQQSKVFGNPAIVIGRMS